MTDLQTRLRDLADEAPRGIDARVLWVTGRRRHRVRVVTASGLALVLLALIGVTGYGDWRSRQPDPAAPPASNSGPMLIPDEFWRPAEWAPSTRAPGRLVALFPEVKHGTLNPFHTTTGPVGIVAGSQAYRYLELPDSVGETVASPALSPDGLHVAYWLSGEPSGAPARDPSIVAIGVLDAVTGQVRRLAVPTAHGLSPEALGWSDAQHVVASFDQCTLRFDNCSSARTVPTQIFDLSDGRVVSSRVDSTDLMGSPGVIAFWVQPSKVVVVGQDSGRAVRHYDVRTTSWPPPVLGPGGAIAGLRAERSPDRIVAGRLIGDHGSGLPLVPTSQKFYGVLAWSDRRHVVATGWTAHHVRETVVLVDVETGEVQVVAEAPPWQVPQIAGDALRHVRTVHAVEPAHPWAPWAFPAAIAITLGLGLLFWRARVGR